MNDMKSEKPEFRLIFRNEDLVECLLLQSPAGELMERDEYDKELIRWANDHYWDSLEKDKHLILRHLRTFAGDVPQQDSLPDSEIVLEGKNYNVHWVDAYTVSLTRCR